MPTDKPTELSRINKQIVLNPFDADTGKFREKWGNTMAADALATHVARSSAAMV